MFKRSISLLCSFLIITLVFPFSAFAEGHTHTFGDNKRGLDMNSLPEGYSVPVTFYETPCTSGCGYSQYSWTFCGASGYYVDKSGLDALTVYSHYRSWFDGIYGKNSTATKFEAGGGQPGTGGAGRYPSGYTSNGVANYNKDGVLIWQPSWPESLSGQFTYQITGYSSDETYPVSNVIRSDTRAASVHVQQSGSRFRIILSPALNRSVFYYRQIISNGYKVSFTAPVTGFYSSSSLKWVDNSAPNSSPFLSANISSGLLRAPQYWKIVSTYLEKGETFSISLNQIAAQASAYNSGTTLVSYEDNLYTPLFTIVPDESTVTKQTNITINNNTWNGNIYQDTTNNLTYIYPQYTTINEAGDTVTNISNNPIIYNSTTNEYYTYDNTTNNYYYITYVTAPDPTATPSPSTNPDPGASPTPTPAPGGASGGGSTNTPESGSSGSSGGQSWWSKLLDKLGNAIVDALLDAISTVLNLILKLFSTILGWIIWFASKSLDLLPFLPPGLSALLVGGVVVCFVIYIIKFIRG